jgi:hypothetical protein
MSGKPAVHGCSTKRKAIEMNLRQLLPFALLAFGIPLAPLNAGAQMPAPVLADSATAQADAGKQLEALLLCKPGTDFTRGDVEKKFRALGLVPFAKSEFAIFVPRKGAKPSVLGAAVAGALYSYGEVEGVKHVEVLFKNLSEKQLMDKLGVTKEETKTGAKTTVVVTGPVEAEADMGSDAVIPASSMVTCRLSVK